MRKVFVDRCNNGFAFPIVMSMVLMSLIASSIMIFKSVSNGVDGSYIDDVVIIAFLQLLLIGTVYFIYEYRARENSMAGDRRTRLGRRTPTRREIPLRLQNSECPVCLLAMDPSVSDRQLTPIYQPFDDSGIPSLARYGTLSVMSRTSNDEYVASVEEFARESSASFTRRPYDDVYDRDSFDSVSIYLENPMTTEDEEEELYKSGSPVVDRFGHIYTGPMKRRWDIEDNIPKKGKKKLVLPKQLIAKVKSIKKLMKSSHVFKAFHKKSSDA